MRVIKNRSVIEYELSAERFEIEPDTEVEAVLEQIQKAPAVTLDFSNYNEGRGYSQAKQLRDRFDYKGDIVALGARKDNVAMIERCGANIIAANEKYDSEDLLPFFSEITDHYQPNY